MMSSVQLLLLSSCYFIYYVGADFLSAGCSDEGCGIPCYLRPAEDSCHYTVHDPCDSGGATELDLQLSFLNNSLMRLQEKLIQKGIIPAESVCHQLPAIENGGVIYSDLLLSIGVTANYVCHNNYDLYGRGTYECSIGGIWIGSDSKAMKQTPTCEGSFVECEALATIPFGHISYQIVDAAIPRPGDLATYSCNTHYFLSGQQERVCLRNGTWSGVEPECIATAQIIEPTTKSPQVPIGKSDVKVYIVAVIVALVLIILIISGTLIAVKIIKVVRRKKRSVYQVLDNQSVFDGDMRSGDISRTKNDGKQKLSPTTRGKDHELEEASPITLLPEQK